MKTRFIFEFSGMLLGAIPGTFDSAAFRDACDIQRIRKLSFRTRIRVTPVVRYEVTQLSELKRRSAVSQQLFSSVEYKV
ncbi:hypothetical protein OUZ56_013122 [Daphnia magna]|uniref:Uncharacterized protein n=1 Tax=Daphnia magna TaxID=35525 RepID=A0ABQ9Z4Z7_9CRUS|nr:hypothetical protein OUZ56_013122 [Daphnia magna]